MSVLVTRPAPQGQELCCQLSQCGIESVHFPLIRFTKGKACDQMMPLIEKSHFLIAVSQPAVHFSHEYLSTHHYKWPKHIRYLAIGQKTAQLLSNLTQQSVNYPKISDSEHFLMLPELQNLTGISIVILRGDGGRELIAQELTKLGAQVHYCEVYQREMIPFNAQTEVQKWQQLQVKQVVITSEIQLNFFVSQIPDLYYPWLFGLRLFVPSERIAQLALKQGFPDIVVVGSASNSDLVAALQPQKKSDRNHQ